MKKVFLVIVFVVVADVAVVVLCDFVNVVVVFVFVVVGILIDAQLFTMI